MGWLAIGSTSAALAQSKPAPAPSAGVLPAAATVQIQGANGMPTAETPYTLYVSSESGNIVSHVEVSSAGWRLVRQVGVGTSMDVGGPHNVAISPNGKYWYVSLAHGTPFGSVAKYTTGRDSLVGKAQVGMFPTTVGLSPDGDWAFIPNSDFHGDRGHMNTVSVLYTPDMSAVAEVPVCDMPHGSRVSRRGATVYLACMMSDELVTMDASTFGVTGRVQVGSGHPMTMAAMDMADSAGGASSMGGMQMGGAPKAPGAASSTMAGQNPDCLTTYVSVAPSDTLVYMACNHSDEMQVRNARTLEIVKRVVTGKGAYNVEPSPDGRFVVVSNKKAQSVSIIDARTLTEVARVPTSKKVPHGIAFSPDHKYVFVTCESIGTDPGAVDAIDLMTFQRVGSLPIPLQPTGVAVWRGTGL